MSKRYFLLLAFSAVFITVILATRTPEMKQTQLLDRNAELSSLAEWNNTRDAVRNLQLQLKSKPSNIKVKLLLVQAYIQEGRITGNHAYYDAVAFKLVNEVLKDEPSHFEALCCKATLQASAHQFHEALITSETAIKINPFNAYIYGVKCDALTELGKYKEAIATADKMVSIRPDLKSYSRIAYLREIHGYYEGATEAMKLALSSGFPGAEQTEWVRVQLGNLYKKTGQTDLAEKQYRESLIHRPLFAPALSGLGDLFRMKNNPDSAIVYYRKAANLVPDYSYYLYTAISARQLNQNQLADSCIKMAEEILINHSHSTDEENGIGHYVDRELSQVYLVAGDYDKAYYAARTEYLRRPSNIDINETLAWAAYKKGSYKEAKFHILSAGRTKSKDAELLYKTGLILKENSLPLISEDWIQSARGINKYVDTFFQETTKQKVALK